jgi:hypothetical protein
VTGRGNRVQPLRRTDRPSPGRPVKVEGINGTLRWGYQVAATLRDYTVTRTKRHATLTAGVVSFNRAFTGPNGVVGTAKQPPLYFVAILQGGAWQWPVKRLEIDATTIRAELGPQE